MLTLRPFQAEDFTAWLPLAQAYKVFYNTPTSEADYQRAWQRLLSQDSVLGLGAWRDEKLLGLTHYLFHASTWAETVCYLQDLFTVPEARGQGVARTLIEAVGQVARERQAARCYWLTQADNETARRLYDRVGEYRGFVRYDLPL
jgi:GNAT superfamily N-acetyltransferase